MITLQEYLIEHLDEGKIWDSIKNWFKNLFEPSDKESDYFGLVYETSNVKDTACLVNSKNNGDDIEIIKLQVIQEFLKYLPVKNVIKLLKESNEFTNGAKRLVVKEKKNKDLYNQVINDCKFEKLYEKDENIAALKLNEESK